jgi:hypothetical protein
MAMSMRKYLILDTAAKAVVLDSDGDPLRFAELEEATVKAVELRGDKSPESYAVLDDLGNKWLWSSKGVLRVALSFDTKSIVHDAIRDMQDRVNESWSMNERCTPEGDVEPEVYAIFHDGPPQPEPYMGRPTGNFTYERYAEKSHWVKR